MIVSAFPRGKLEDPADYLQLGETSNTAYRGDRGKIAYDHSQTTHAPTIAATESTTGLMSNADKTKLNGIANNANNYSHPNSGVSSGTYSKVTVNTQGHITGGSNITPSEIGAATTVLYSTNIDASGWSGSAAPYSKSIAVSGLLSTDVPIIDLVQSGTESTDSVMRENWGKVTRITTAVNTIVVYASEAPSAAMPIQLKVIR